MNCHEYLRVLLNQLREVVKQAVLRAKEVKLIVPLLFLHQLRQELPPIPSHKLRRQLHHIQVKGRDGGRICNELKLRRWLFGNNGLLDHLGLHLWSRTETAP